MGRKNPQTEAFPERTGSVEGWRSLLAAIVESSDDAMISKNLEGLVTSWNPAAEQMFGYAAAEMIGQSILHIVPPQLHDQEEAMLRRLQAGEKVERLETLRRRKDGQLVEVSLTLSPVRDGDGRIIGAASVSHDITERKKLERQLIRSEKLAATGRMAATVAHEINNPLESVLNFVYLARRSTPSSDQAHSYLLSAEAELDRVAQIIRRVLGYYGDAGRQEEVYLHDILAEALAVYQAQFHAGGISVDCRYEDLRRIAVNWNEFAQIFSTILSDSLQILPRAASIRFDVEDARSAEQEGIRVGVRLRAPGIAREILDRAFQPLAAVRSMITSSMGLSVARELLEKRGAQVTFKSGSSSEVSDASICIFVPFA
jgi:PAS domain S-box-containing protein